LISQDEENVWIVPLLPCPWRTLGYVSNVSLFWFSCVFWLFVFGAVGDDDFGGLFDGGVVLCGDEGGHVEGLSAEVVVELFWDVGRENMVGAPSGGSVRRC
jgi:hypothetical protein